MTDTSRVVKSFYVTVNNIGYDCRLTVRSPDRAQVKIVLPAPGLSPFAGVKAVHRIRGKGGCAREPGSFGVEAGH